MGTLPMILDANHVWVPVTVDGRTGPAMLDTGSFASYVDPSLLPKTRGGGGMVATMSASGTHAAMWRWIRSFEVGPLHWTRDVRVVVAGVPSPHDQPDAIAGLGADFLSNFDYDLDFPHRRMTIYATENCIHPEPPWPTKSFALPIGRPEQGFAYTIPVQFEGGALNAMIDTGAGYTTMDRAGAQKIGLTRQEIESGAQAYVEDVFQNDKKENLRWHVFSEVAIGEDVLKNAKFGVFENHRPSDLPIDMVLGMDYLQTRHIWLSLSTNAFYVDTGEPKEILPGKT